VNDNFGEWRSNASQLLTYCTRPEAVGREFVAEIAPDQEDYFVLKPMHSAFYQTPLEALLRYFEARTIILCGLATNSCIMYTAHDARMRDIELIVTSDCCAARTPKEHEQALAHIKAMAGARILQGKSIRF
jgi:nicotinamidase-related amidase